MDASRFLNVKDDDVARARIEFYHGAALIHIEFRKRAKAMRYARWALPQVKAWLKAMGHNMVYVLIPAGNERLLRFARLFGFRLIDRDARSILAGQEC